jgi:hypothetical protein
MTAKEEFVRLLKHYVELIENTPILDEFSQVTFNLEQIEVTQSTDAVRRFEIGNGRSLIIEWREKQGSRV